MTNESFNKVLLRKWKKVFKSDLAYIVYEMKDLIKPPCMIILEGDLGAGKTTFTQAFSEEQIMSPTYSILSETSQMLHADFYRIENSSEIMELDLSLYLEDKKFFFVEWGKKFFKRLQLEIPEHFGSYYMEIVINEGSSESSEGLSRNFYLYSFDKFDEN